MAAKKKNSVSHEWDDDGSTCIKCGDKDWMPDTNCSESKIKPQEESWKIDGEIHGD